MKGSLQQLQIKALALWRSLVVYFSGILGFKGQMQSEVLRCLAETSCTSLTISWLNAPLNLNLNNSYLPVRNGLFKAFRGYRAL